MDRRDFLRALGPVGLGLPLSACAHAFRISSQEMARPQGGPGTDRDPAGVWREGAAYARWTPSPHNVQPWRLRIVSPTRAELYYDPRRLLPKTDPTSCFTVAGLAMFVEYLSVAVRPRGYQVRARFVAKPLDYAATRPTLFADLELRATSGFGPGSYPDRNLILARKTSRLRYDGKPVDDKILEALAATARKHGHQLAWSSDPAVVDWTIDLNRFTLFADLDDPSTRGELRQWIRCDNGEAEAKRDGLWSYCMRFPGWLFRGFFDEHEKYGQGWRRALCGKLLVDGMSGTRTVAWWSGPFAGPEDWIRSGTLLARSWLQMTHRGVHLHPFGSIITNPQAYARLKDKLARETSGRVWLLVRMGHSDDPPRSYRLDEPAIFLDDKELA